jgi:hypothetical protein
VITGLQKKLPALPISSGSVGKPYFQQITKADNGVNIARMVLSGKPYVADESEALMNLLQGLGTM